LKTRLVAITVLCLAVSTLCLAQKTSINWNRSTDFSSYHTYMWERSPNPAKGEWNQRILDDVDKQLQAKGLTKVDSNPDLWVVYSNSIQLDKQVVGVGYVSGGLPLTSGGPAGYSTFVNKIGTLVVEIADTKTKQLVWRGAVSDTISNQQSKNIKTLDTAVTKLFRDYPPKQKK
jgi:hypothetical protein